MTIIWFIFFSYMSLNLLNTAPFDSYHCITGKCLDKRSASKIIYISSFVSLDEHANLMSMESERISDRPSDWIPELHDIPISLVNIVLYQAQGKSNNSEMVTNYYTDEMSEEDAAVKKRHGKRKNKGKWLHKAICLLHILHCCCVWFSEKKTGTTWRFKD